MEEIHEATYGGGARNCHALSMCATFPAPAWTLCAPMLFSFFFSLPLPPPPLLLPPTPPLLPPKPPPPPLLPPPSLLLLEASLHW